MIVTVIVPDRNIWSALIAGVDSGIHYWCKEVTAFGVLRRMAGATAGDLFADWCKRDDDILFEEREPRYRVISTWRLTGDDIARGITVLAAVSPHQFGRLLVDGGDADTGDALIQCALFGEIVYG